MSSEETKRKLKEVIALYTLEKSLKDIFVEGITDKNFYQNFLDSKKIVGNFVEISTIDFSSIDAEFREELDFDSNRDVLIALSRAFNKQPEDLNVRCLIDRDFDDYISSEDNYYLWRTDFTCLESYLFCIEVKNKFIKIGLVNFPFEGEKIILEVGKVLRFIFSIRLWRAINYPSKQLVALDKSLKVDKSNGKIYFDEEGYLSKFLLRNGLKKEEERIKEEIKTLQAKLNNDVRYAMNKKDFLKILYLYVNKIKNVPNYEEDALNKALYLTPECSHLEIYPLFKKLKEFFEKIS